MELTASEYDALCELMNIAEGRAAAALAGILNRRVKMHVVDVRLLNRGELIDFLSVELGAIGSVVSQRFSGELNGNALFLLTPTHASRLVRALLQEERDLASLTSAERTVLAEVGNVVLNACIAVLSDQLNTRVRFQLPQVLLNLSGSALVRSLIIPWEQEHRGLVLTSRMTVGEVEIIAHVLIVLMLREASIRKLLDSLLE